MAHRAGGRPRRWRSERRKSSRRKRARASSTFCARSRGLPRVRSDTSPDDSSRCSRRRIGSSARGFDGATASRASTGSRPPSSRTRLVLRLGCPPGLPSTWESHAAGESSASRSSARSGPRSGSPLDGLKYRLVGPFRGGRATGVAGVISEPNTYYFGAATGGLWKTIDGGTSWKPLWDDFPEAAPAVGAVAVAPSDPKIVYAGTGEINIRGNVATGNGLYKSTDAGKTWRFSGLHETPDLVRWASPGLVDPRRGDGAAQPGAVVPAASPDGPRRGLAPGPAERGTVQRVSAATAGAAQRSIGLSQRDQPERMALRLAHCDRVTGRISDCRRCIQDGSA